MNPTSFDGWIKVALERATDARALLQDVPRHVAAVYLAGYAIECSLKAYLQRSGLPPPRYGREGHSLRGLWEQAGFRVSDLSDTAGEKTFFIERWSTDLRYEVRLDVGLTADGLVDAASKLSSYVQSQLRWRGTRRL